MLNVIGEKWLWNVLPDCFQLPGKSALIVDRSIYVFSYCVQLACNVGWFFFINQHIWTSDCYVLLVCILYCWVWNKAIELKCGCICLMSFPYLSCLGAIICDINSTGTVSLMHAESVTLYWQVVQPLTRRPWTKMDIPCDNWLNDILALMKER